MFFPFFFFLEVIKLYIYTSQINYTTKSICIFKPTYIDITTIYILFKHMFDSTYIHKKRKKTHNQKKQKKKNKLITRVVYYQRCAKMPIDKILTKRKGGEEQKNMYIKNTTRNSTKKFLLQ